MRSECCTSFCKQNAVIQDAPLSLILAQNINITFWLTPVWILSAGITLGFLLALLTYVKLSVMQRIPLFNSISASRSTLIPAGIVLTLAYLLIYAGFLYWLNGKTFDLNRDLQPLLYMLPLCAILGFGAWTLVAKNFASEFPARFNEGLLKWINRICIVFTIFFILGFPLAKFNGFGVIKPVEEPVELMKSLGRLPFLGTTTKSFTIPPSEKNHTGDPIEIRFNGRELKSMSVSTTEPIELGAEPITGDLLNVLRVDPSEDSQFFRPRPDGTGMIKHQPYEQFYVSNLGYEDAEVSVTWTQGPFYSEVVVIPIIGVLVLGCYLFNLLLASAFPKVSAIALSTFKTEVSQPLFLLVLVVGAAFVVTAINIP